MTKKGKIKILKELLDNLHIIKAGFGLCYLYYHLYGDFSTYNEDGWFGKLISKHRPKGKEKGEHYWEIGEVEPRKKLLKKLIKELSK